MSNASEMCGKLQTREGKSVIDEIKNTKFHDYFDFFNYS